MATADTPPSGGKAARGVAEGASTAPRVVVALDFADAQDALALVRRLDPQRCGLQVGKGMFVAAWLEGRSG